MTLYERIGRGYSSARRDDPRIAAALRAALGTAQSVVNVGAGTGSYEPSDLDVIAVEPSLRMIAQRPAGTQVIRGVAEALPLVDDAADAALAVLTVHHWTNLSRGCQELWRVARQRVVVLTYDAQHPGFWLTQDYFPEFAVEDEQRFVPPAEFGARIGGEVRVTPLPIPYDCEDGFLGAYWRRPEAYLDPTLRRGISSFAARDPEELAPGLNRLEDDLATGRWAARHGALRELDELDLGYVLVTCSKPGA